MKNFTKIIRQKIQRTIKLIVSKRNMYWLNHILLKSDPTMFDFICSECLKKDINFIESKGVAYYESLFFMQIKNTYSSKNQSLEIIEQTKDLSSNTYSVLKKIISYKIPQKNIPFEQNIEGDMENEFNTLHYYLYANFCVNQKRPKLEHVILSSLSNYSQETLNDFNFYVQNEPNTLKKSVLSEMLEKSLSLKQIYQIKEQKKIDTVLKIL